MTLSLQPWPGSSASDGGLQEDFAHDGLTNSQAKAQWRATDFTTPTQSQGTATATATVASGVITAINVVLSGYNYTSAPTVQITDPTGTGATATAVDQRRRRRRRSPSPMAVRVTAARRRSP